MNPWPTARIILALLATVTATATFRADDEEEQAATSDAASVDITIDEAKEMVLDFISAEEAKEKKAGQKTPFFVTASRPILEKREMVRDDKTGELIWGSWQIDRSKRVVRLQTSAIGVGKLA